jgi:hypothetical protein
MTKASESQIRSDNQGGAHSNLNIDALPTLQDYTSATLSEKDKNALSYMYGVLPMIKLSHIDAVQR